MTAKQASVRSAKRVPVQKVSFSSFMERGWMPYLWIAVVVVLVYGRTAGFDFVRLDDSTVIMRSIPFFQDANNLFTPFWTFFAFDLYRPFSLTFGVLVGILAGITPRSLHIASMLLHYMACSAFFVLLTRLEYRRMLALLLALCFSLHPLLAQGVAWVAAQNELLLAAIFFLSVAAFVVFARTGNLSALALHCLLYALALFTRESAVLLPVMCGLYALLHARPEHQVHQAQPLHRSQVLTTLAVWLVITVLWFALRGYVLSQAPPIPAELKNTNIVGLQAMMLNWRTVPELLGKMLLPLNLSVYPAYSTFSTVLGAVLFPLAALGALWVAKGKGSSSLRVVAFGLVWAVLCILPPLAIRPIAAGRYDYFDQRAYLGLAGIIIVCAELATRWGYGDDSGEQGKAFTKRLHAGVAVLLVVFGVASFMHSAAFTNERTFWQAAVAGNPASAEAHGNVGYNLLMEQRYAEAEREFRTAIALDSTYALGYVKLGIAIHEQRKGAVYLEAQTLIERGRALAPYSDDGHVSLVVLHVLEQRFEAALQAQAVMEQRGFKLENYRPDAAQILANYKRMKAEGSIKPQ
jgi:hypothetical protein